VILVVLRLVFSCVCGWVFSCMSWLMIVVVLRLLMSLLMLKVIVSICFF